MNITSTKIYAKGSSLSSLRNPQECLLQKVDVTIEGIEAKSDFLEVLNHLQGWGWEMGFDLSIDGGIPSCSCTGKSEETCQAEGKGDIVDFHKKRERPMTDGEKENIYRAIKDFVLYTWSAKKPIPVSWIVYNIQKLNPKVLGDMDGLYEVFFDLITGLRKRGYTFLWDESCTYYIYQALYEEHNKKNNHGTGL